MIKDSDSRILPFSIEENDKELPWFLVGDALTVYQYPRRYLCLDFETNNKDKGSALNKDNHIVLACWLIVDEKGGIIKKHRWSDEYGLHELEQDIATCDFIVAHNAKFELQWLKRCGLELRDILVWDTMLAEWVIAGNRAGLPGWEINLDATAKRYGLGQKLSLASQLIHLGVDPADIPREWLEPYCYMDVHLCHNIFLKQMDILLRDNLLHLVLTRNLCCSVLADIEFNGCELDAERVQKEYEDSILKFQKVDAELHEITGGINLSSPKQVGDYLYNTLSFSIPEDHKGNKLVTKGGAPKTDNATIALLKAVTPEQERFLSLYKERNKLDSLISKNLEFFKLICEQHGSTFYGVYNQGFTGTHRLSSSGRPVLFQGLKKPKGVQLQNLPRQYKKLFTAIREGYKVGEVDGAQLEFRVAADMGNDATATEEIINGFDVHSFTAKVLTDAGEFTTRQDAKASTFAPINY